MPDSTPAWHLLKNLRDEPWLTADQVSAWSQVSLARTYVHLGHLLRQGWVQRLNPHSPYTNLRAVYALTDWGVRALAQQATTDEKAYRQQHHLTRQRHMEILWQLERVSAVRDFYLSLSGNELRILVWRTWLRTMYPFRQERKQIVLHGSGILADPSGRVLPFVIEWDTHPLPPDRKRLAQLREWLHPWVAYGPQRNLPIMLLVTADAAREHMLYQQLCANGQSPAWHFAALRLTTETRLRLHGPHAPIWWEPFQPARVIWHAKGLWRAAGARGIVPAAKSCHSRIGVFGKSAETRSNLSRAEQLLDLKLRMLPQAKRVLLQVATRPLLTIGETALLLGEHADRVGKAFQALERAGLVEGLWHANTHRYCLTTLGMQYETAEAGYGQALKHYWRRSGGRSGFKRLAVHLEHTIATNEFFLQWLTLARRRQVRFEWIHEMASARYFRYANKWHRLLPDGSGVWHEKENPFRFVVEIDRSRESGKNLRAKFEEYRAWRFWRDAQGGEPEPQVLVVTTSWTQANVVIRAMEAAFGRLGMPYAIWLTTFEELKRRGLEQARWRLNQKAEGFYALPCFTPKATPSAPIL